MLFFQLPQPPPKYFFLIFCETLTGFALARRILLGISQITHGRKLRADASSHKQKAKRPGLNLGRLCVVALLVHDDSLELEPTSTLVQPLDACNGTDSRDLPAQLNEKIEPRSMRGKKGKKTQHSWGVAHPPKTSKSHFRLFFHFRHPFGPKIQAHQFSGREIGKLRKLRF